MIGAKVLLRIPIGHSTRGKIGLHADYRFDPSGLGRPIEFDGAKHRAMIGQGNGRHVERFGTFDEL